MFWLDKKHIKDEFRVEYFYRNALVTVFHVILELGRNSSENTSIISARTKGFHVGAYPPVLSIIC